MNTQYFSKEQVIAGELNEFLEVLLKQCYGKGTTFNDIHIKPEDCGAFVIEWEETPWSGEWGGHWQYIKDDEEEVVMKYYYFPDDHYELFETKEQYEEALKEWLEEHKEEGWYKNEWGQWRSKKSEEELKKSLEEDNNEQLDDDEANDEFLYHLRSKYEDSNNKDALDYYNLGYTNGKFDRKHGSDYNDSGYDDDEYSRGYADGWDDGDYYVLGYLDGSFDRRNGSNYHTDRHDNDEYVSGYNKGWDAWDDELGEDGKAKDEE